MATNWTSDSIGVVMNCCCPHARSGGKCFSFFARRYRRRFEKKGFEKSQKQLLEGLARVGYHGATLLEIGSGVGHLHQSLLEQGARFAIGVDFAPGMVSEARAWASERGLAGQTEYIEGDFVTLDAPLEPAEVTILDKVICCYPDADTLVHKSLAKSRRVYALTYPRDRGVTRVGVKFMAVLMWLTRSNFRNYVHDPRQVEAWIRAAGYKKSYENSTFLWLTQVYVHD